jgi:hypothetical protein
MKLTVIKSLLKLNRQKSGKGQAAYGAEIAEKQVSSKRRDCLKKQDRIKVFGKDEPAVISAKKPDLTRCPCQDILLAENVYHACAFKSGHLYL